MRSSLIGFIVHKDVVLLNELWALNEEEKLADLSISVVGTIEAYEDFLAGYATRRQNLTASAHKDIQSFNPLSESTLANWLAARKEKYPALMVYLQQLEELRGQLLSQALDF